MPKFLYPRFYIKSVGGTFTIEHRLTHSFISTVDTEKELKAEIKRLNEMDEEKLWEWLVLEKRIRLPQQKALSVLAKASREQEHDEEWFRDAWSVYTDLFYTQNPNLLVEEKELPIGIINKIRRNQYEKEKVVEESRRRELEEAVAREQENERVSKRQLLKKKKEPEADGKLGNVASLERMGNKKKKLVKKLKVKTPNPDSVFEILDTDDPFA